MGNPSVRVTSSDSVTLDLDAPVVTLVSPIGAEAFLGGTAQTVTWSCPAVDLAANPMTLEYSLDSGATWQVIPRASRTAAARPG